MWLVSGCALNVRVEGHYNDFSILKWSLEYPLAFRHLAFESRPKKSMLWALMYAQRVPARHTFHVQTTFLRQIFLQIMIFMIWSCIFISWNYNLNIGFSSTPLPLEKAVNISASPLCLIFPECYIPIHFFESTIFQEDFWSVPQYSESTPQ